MSVRAITTKRIAALTAMGTVVFISMGGAAQQQAHPNAVADELAQLGEATQQAFAHSEQHGVAIVFHIGDDIRNHEQPAALQAWLQEQFREGFAQEGIQVGVFPSPNFGTVASGLTYHVGTHIYRPHDPIMNLQEGMDAIVDVAEQGLIALQLVPMSDDGL